MTDLPEHQVHLPAHAGTVISVLCSVVLALGLLGGWIWAMSGQSYAVGEVTRRVEIVEKRLDADNKTISDIADRLARMEPMLTYLVKRMDMKSQ